MYGCKQTMMIRFDQLEHFKTEVTPELEDGDTAWLEEPEGTWTRYTVREGVLVAAPEASASPPGKLSESR